VADAARVPREKVRVTRHWCQLGFIPGAATRPNAQDTIGTDFTDGCFSDARNLEWTADLVPERSGMRVLLIGKSGGTPGTLASQLERADFLVEVSSLKDAGEALKERRFSVVLLDLDAPDRGSLAFVRELRSRGDSTPILMLSQRISVADRVAALEDGTDDIMTKPFELGELIARIQALLRRSPTLLGTTLKLGDLLLDTDQRRAFISDVPLPLSVREVSVLEMLMRRSGRIVPKKFIEDQLFGLAADITSNSIEVCVHRIRKQLAEAEAKVRVQTVKGIGYLITEET
jgi:DNA-binding response OmpR family regulator